RGPLREALQRLCQEGLLVSHRNRGVFVTELSIADIREIYEVRESVETAAANTLLDGSHEQLQDTCEVLKEVIRDMAKQVAGSDWQELARLDMQFHTSFVAGTGNTRLIRIYETLAAESRMCILNLEVSYPWVDVLVEEHQKVLDLLEAGDRKGLLKAIKRHMQKAVEDLTATTQQDK
ncbi:GntR family transcriptional regulator, partial [Arthrobacter sp. NPDC093139]|uniref:GntR family transcriptional regulator n=1 Tax=Arthrobacter sp. NPDC093139 TaxID=3363945 RepID=UPI0037F54FC0